MAEQKELLLVDVSGYIFRAYYALPPLTRSDGLPTGAVFGFCNMLVSLLQKPETYVAVVFDSGRQNFRHDIYPAYKSNRQETPEDLVPQFPYFRKAVEAMGLPILELKGFEADDVIATFASRAKQDGFLVKIYSKDKDMMQLIEDGVVIEDPFKYHIIGEKEVLEKFGVSPDKVADVQALAGDPTDGFNGLPGIGPKTAAELINQFGNVENLLANIDQIKPERRRKIVSEHQKELVIFKQLALLRRDVPLLQDVGSDWAKLLKPDPLPLATIDNILNFFHEMEFESLIKKWTDKYNNHTDHKNGHGEKKSFQPRVKQLAKKSESSDKSEETTKINSEKTERDSIEFVIPNRLVKDLTIIEVKDHVTLTAMTHAVFYAGRVGLFVFQQYMLLALESGVVYACPIQHKHWLKRAGELTMEQMTGLNNESDKLGNDILTGLDFFAKDINKVNPDDGHMAKEFWHGLQHIIAAPEVLKITYGASRFWQNWLDAIKQAIVPNNLEDVAVMNFCLAAGLKQEHIFDDDVWQANWQKQLKEKYKQALKKQSENNSKPNHAQLEQTVKQELVQQELPNAAKIAYDFLFVGLQAYQKLQNQNLSRLYYQIERPLFPILASMSNKGIMVDLEKFSELAIEFEHKIQNLATKVFQFLGQEFNLSSPKQLGEVLANSKKISIDSLPKTKTGALSTSSDVLEPLTDDYPILADVLQHRHLEKLMGTYVRALPQLAVKDNQANPRIHTYFSAIGAQTGRLSSINPNLQNIPIRGEEGAKLRECFVAPTGKLLLSLDYSQIELRVLALLTDVPSLRQAFATGADIHSSTAAEIFHCAIDKVTPDLRRKAKAVNFGIIYGISAFGLARQLDITRNEAKTIIETYHQQFKGIGEFMQKAIAHGDDKGYVTTMYGRRIYLPGLKLKGPMREYAKRQAMNAPLQGTAADIMKRAMIKVAQLIAKNYSRGEVIMLLQVHDELVFEVDADKVEKIAKEIQAVMQRVEFWHGFSHSGLPKILGQELDSGLSQKLNQLQNHQSLLFPVDIGYGKNWRLAH